MEDRFAPNALMPDPLQSLAFRMLQQSACADQHGDAAPKLSRRAFLGLSALLTSCATQPESVLIGQDPITSRPDTRGPIPRNPTMRLKSNFSLANQDITYRRALVSGNLIAMTFDDGPQPENTPRLLDILRERNIKATFYVIGKCVNAYPDVVRRTVEEGHEIGNHSQTHRLLSSLGDSALHWEMQSCRDAVLNASGYHMRTMRPPYGGLNQRQRELVYQTYGYPTILWSVDPLDWQNRIPSVISSRIVSHTHPGAIVLAHDLHATTVSAMPSTLDQLLYRGYKFVTVSQLLALHSEHAKEQAQGLTANP